MACLTMSPMTFRRLEWSAKKLQHPNNTYSYRQRSSAEGKPQLESSLLDAKLLLPEASPTPDFPPATPHKANSLQPLVVAGATSPFLVSKAVVLQPRPQRKEPYETACSTAGMGEFTYPDPLVGLEGPLEFHKRIAVLKKYVHDTNEWELYHRRILSQEAPKPWLLPTSHGVHSLRRTMSHSNGSTSSTELVQSTDQKHQKRSTLKKGISLPDMVLAVDLCSAPERPGVSLPNGRTLRRTSSATEQLSVSTCATAQLHRSSCACDDRNVKGPPSAEKKTVKKKTKAVPAVSDSPEEERVRPTTPAPSTAKQTRKKKRSSSRPSSAKLIHKAAKKLPHAQSAK